MRIVLELRELYLKALNSEEYLYKSISQDTAIDILTEVFSMNIALARHLSHDPSSIQEIQTISIDESAHMAQLYWLIVQPKTQKEKPVGRKWVNIKDMGYLICA